MNRIVGLIAGAAAMVIVCGGRACSTEARPAMDDAALDKMASLVGGTWTWTDGKGFVVEHRYELAMGGKAVRGLGIIGKGGPRALPVETMFGWDPARKTAYYVDFHGHDTVYAGTATAEGQSVLLAFKQIVGPAGDYRARIDFVDHDTFRAVIMAKRGNTWADVDRMTFTRHA